MGEEANYYSILGLPRGCSGEEIRLRFRELAREHHPDRFAASEKTEAEQKFQEITQAFNVLTNPERRAIHDFDLDIRSRVETDAKAVAQACLVKGIEAFRDRNWEGAVRNFEMAANHDPDNAVVAHHLSLAAARVPAHLRQAVTAAEKTIQIEPRNPDFLRDAGWVFRMAGLWTRAEKCYSEALRWNPGSGEIRSGLEEARAHRVPSVG